MEHHDIVDTVEELGAEGLSHGPVNLMAHLLLVLAGQIGDSLEPTLDVMMIIVFLKDTWRP